MHKKFKKRFCIILGAALLPVLFSILCTYIADPLEIIRNRNGEEGCLVSNQRYIDAGIIQRYVRHADAPTSIIMGTSMTQNFVPEELSAVLHWPTPYSLGISGGYPGEQLSIINFALKSKNVTHVLWGLHHFFSQQQGWESHPYYDFPHWLYTGHLWDKAPYLLDYKMLLLSQRLLLGKTPTPRPVSLHSVWMGWPERLLMFHKFTSPSAFAKQRSAAPKPITELLRSSSFPAIDKVLFTTVREHPETRFTIFFPPYSLYFYAKAPRHRIRTLQMVQYIVSKLSLYPNLEVYGFDDVSAIVANMANYRDPGHYGIGVNRYILASIARKQHLLTAKNIAQYVRSSLDLFNTYPIYQDKSSTVAFEGPFNTDLFTDCAFPPLGPQSPLRGIYSPPAAHP